MEDALRGVLVALYLQRKSCVLILVLMEDALRGVTASIQSHLQHRLNPCSNGRCSARPYTYVYRAVQSRVLILVLMEDALREATAIAKGLKNEQS